MIDSDFELAESSKSTKKNQEPDPIEFYSPIPFPQTLKPIPKQNESQDDELLKTFK